MLYEPVWPAAPRSTPALKRAWKYLFSCGRAANPTAHTLHLSVTRERGRESRSSAGKRGEQVGETKRINLRVGTAAQVGSVSLTTWLPDRVFLSVSSDGGYGPTVVLTPEQVQELRRALDEITPHGEETLRLVA